VAVAYKLVEAVYRQLPSEDKQPLEYLLDLVAIGLIADLVELKGDCRYLAQKGIEQLKLQASEDKYHHPGVHHLLRLCKSSGDRPTAISFGIGPRINAVSRIQGNARFCVELLTSQDEPRCKQLAEKAELLNTRRKELQKNTLKQVEQRVAELDLSTTGVIVLADPQWQGGVLGLAAGQIAQSYGRPTILLTIDEEAGIARGSARSVNSIDLYKLVHSQRELLLGFGGHPFAAGLSLPLENLDLFINSINQGLRQQAGDPNQIKPTIAVDLVVTVAKLGPDLFRELKLLEPCGMGNPTPNLLIKNCWVEGVWNKNITDRQGKAIRYLRTTFQLFDESTHQGFKGQWWGHGKDDLPGGHRFDAIVSLDFNTYEGEYIIDLVDIKPTETMGQTPWQSPKILDFRQEQNYRKQEDWIVIDRCPDSWRALEQSYQRARQSNHPLALAYREQWQRQAEQCWRQLMGMAKYLARTGEEKSLDLIGQKLEINSTSLHLGLEALASMGFNYAINQGHIAVKYDAIATNLDDHAIELFLFAVAEEQFQRHFFQTVPLPVIEKHLA
jgi:single-stranded-DNA-specific exonuclease